LGRTKLEVSVAGLGTGGASRLGQAHGATIDESVALVRRAIELGVNYIDTASGYGTEEIVGIAVAGHRDEVVLSSKAPPRRREDHSPVPASEFRATVHESLERLRTDYIDVFHLHGVTPDRYEYCLSELAPELMRLRDEGKIGHVAISEGFDPDPGHEMLVTALEDDCWEIFMVGMNLLNQSARDRVCLRAAEQGVGIEIMYAVRRAFSDPVELRRVVSQLVEEGRVDGNAIDITDPFGFLVHDGGAGSVTEAAYRFARHSSHGGVVLTGTGSIEHLEQNVAAINAGPLPSDDLDLIVAVFGHLDHLSGG
jgi:L-galactose dehydrogenase